VVLPIMERALTAEGVTVETITTDDDGPGQRNDKGDGEVREENGVIRRYFPKQSEFYKISLPMGKWLRRNVRSYDVVHVHAMFSHTSVAACRAARAAGVPYIIRPLGVLTHYGVSQRRAVLKRLCLRWVDGPLLRDAAAVHFTLPIEQTEAEELGIRFKSVVVPLGLEPQALPPASASGPRTVLYLSRIDPKKNLVSLLTAWATIIKQGAVGLDRRLARQSLDGDGAGPLIADGVNRERRNNRGVWQLVIAGGGQPAYEESLRAHASSLGLGESVRWVGHVTGDAKSRLLADADIFVLPSYSENFGIAAAEALLAGKPCLFTPGVAVGALAAEHGAAVLSREDADSIATALQQLLADAERRRELGRRGKTFAVAELSASVMGKRLKTLYQGILKQVTV
jgi:glycosyltransferase involved in cell wall biosynthesis